MVLIDTQLDQRWRRADPTSARWDFFRKRLALDPILEG
jgi:hypothetical protein